MKKSIYYILLYIVFCSIQFYFAKYLNINEFFPNLILIVVVYIGFSRGTMDAQLMGFLFGLTWDAFSIDVFGARTIMFTIIGFISGKISRNFDKDNVISQILVVFFAGILYSLGFGVINMICLDNTKGIFSFTAYGLIRIAITSLLTPVVFYILERRRNGSSLL